MYIAICSSIIVVTVLFLAWHLTPSIWCVICVTIFGTACLLLGEAWCGDEPATLHCLSKNQVVCIKTTYCSDDATILYAIIELEPNVIKCLKLKPSQTPGGISLGYYYRYTGKELQPLKIGKKS